MDEPADISFDDLEDLLTIDEPDVPSEDEADLVATAPSHVVTSQSSQPSTESRDQVSCRAVTQESVAPPSPPPLLMAANSSVGNTVDASGDSSAEQGAPLVEQGGMMAGSRKRALDELLCGDDIGGHDWAPQLEKRRQLQEQALARQQLQDQLACDIIHRIRANRVVNATGDTGASSDSTRTSVSSAGEKIHRTMPSGGNFQKLTYDDGRRLYLSVKQRPDTILLDRVRPRAGLLGISFEQLKAQAAQVNVARLRCREEQSVLDKLDSWQLKTADHARTAGTESAAAGCDVDNQLWASCFHPSCYTDLISDEVLNRSLLRWIKLWDKLVFGTEVAPPHIDKKQLPKFNAKGKQIVRRPAFEVIEQLDASNRPSQRAALLCGPPGLGKTTLAHVLARHAGYNVVELNASDDRSVEAFRTALENCTQMMAMVGDRPRPNCLVIDEIDGAPAATINYLVSVLTAKDNSAGGGGGGGGAAGGGGKKKKRRGPAPVSRPIICICNELYTASLRPLRQVALVMPFSAVSSERLSLRLFEICRLKSLETDLSALLCLCQRAGNDIRSCLGFLQFVKSRSASLTARQVQVSTIGQKDHHQSLMSGWRQIFTIFPPSRAALCVPNGTGESPDEAAQTATRQPSTVSLAQARFNNITATVGSCGEYDKLTQGVFENYLIVHSKEANLRTLCSALDWMCFNDTLSAEIYRSQSFMLMAYQVFVGVALHFLLATPKRCKLTFPQAEYEASQRRARVGHVLDAVLAAMPAAVRCHNTCRLTLLLDTLALLTALIQPSLRPVSCQLYSEREQAELRRVVDVMIDYGVTYRHQQSEEGHHQFVLDPDVELVCRLSDEPGDVSDRSTAAASLQFTVKQLVAREIELERVRRTEKATQKTTHRSIAAATAAPAAAVSKPWLQNGANQTAQQQRRLQHTGHDSVEKTEARDFFGRVIVKSAEAVASKQSADENDAVTKLLRNDIWYHFKEGYNNAVRRTVRVKDLL